MYESDDYDAEQATEALIATISGLVTVFLWDDRKEDEELPRDRIEQLIADGHVSRGDIVGWFTDALNGNLDGTI